MTRIQKELLYIAVLVGVGFLILNWIGAIIGFAIAWVTLKD